MKTPKPLPSQEELHRLFIYEPDTGFLRWRHRPEMLDRHNTRFAGKVAGKVALYVEVSINNELYFAHRIIWKMVTGREPPSLDHADRNGANNRWENLREATPSLNSANRRTKVRGLPRGVREVNGIFYAEVIVNQIRHPLGSFATAERAEEAYRRAAAQHFGEFAFSKG
jgi:HNH endonuclease